MANAYNPYEIANIDILSDIAQKQTVQQRGESVLSTKLQKSKLKKQFVKEQEEAIKRFRKKSKGGIFGKLSSPWISGLLSLVATPLAGALASGIGTAGMGIATREAAKDLPGMEGWKTTFLSDTAKGQEDIYSGLKSKAPSLLGSLLSGAVSGVTSYGVGEALGAGKDVKVFPGTKGKVGKRFGQPSGVSGLEYDKFFKRLAKRFDPKIMKTAFEKSKVLGKPWVQLLQTAPELAEGDLTDFLYALLGNRVKTKTDVTKKNTGEIK